MPTAAKTGRTNATFPYLAISALRDKAETQQPLFRARYLGVRIRKNFGNFRAIKRCKQFKRLSVDILDRPPAALVESAPPAVLLVHPHKAKRNKLSVAPTGKAQKPRRMRTMINAPLCEMGGLNVLELDHADRSLVSTCGTMPSTVAGPAVGIEIHTRASFAVAPSNGRFWSVVISSSGES